MQLQLAKGAINTQIALLLANKTSVFALDYRRCIINCISAKTYISCKQALIDGEALHQKVITSMHKARISKDEVHFIFFIQHSSWHNLSIPMPGHAIGRNGEIYIMQKTLSYDFVI